MVPKLSVDVALVSPGLAKQRHAYERDGRESVSLPPRGRRFPRFAVVEQYPGKVGHHPASQSPAQVTPSLFQSVNDFGMAALDLFFLHLLYPTKEGM